MCSRVYTPEEVIHMKKKPLRIICICLAAAAVLTLCGMILNSSLEYQLMSQTEQLKAQLEKEYRMYATELIEHVEIQRPWYSLSPFDWTYVVTFSSGSETAYCRRKNRGFVEIRQ